MIFELLCVYLYTVNPSLHSKPGIELFLSVEVSYLHAMLEYKNDFLQSIPNPPAKISGTTYSSSAVNITRGNLYSLKLRMNWTYCNCGSSSSIITAKKIFCP